MKIQQIRNFHVPLPAQTYTRLRLEAARRNKPATQLVKQAVEYWLAGQERLALHEEIAAYAAEHAGTVADLDEDMERAAVELLAPGEKE